MTQDGAGQKRLTLYHHTSEASAKSIASSRQMWSSAPVDMPFAFFSTRIDGKASGASGYGPAAVEVCLPAAIAREDAVYLSGERFLKVPLAELRAEFFVGLHLPDPPPRPPTVSDTVDQTLAIVREALGDAAGDIAQLRPALRRLGRLSDHDPRVIEGVSAALRCQPRVDAIQHAVLDLAEQASHGHFRAPAEIPRGADDRLRGDRSRSTAPIGGPRSAGPRIG